MRRERPAVVLTLPVRSVSHVRVELSAPLAWTPKQHHLLSGQDFESVKTLVWSQWAASSL